MAGVSAHIALLRGINVGRAKRVAMADLRALFESLGCADVTTLLNSGNVVFKARTPPTSARIEAALVARLGVAAATTMLTARELGEIVAENPLVNVADDPSRLLVAVLFDPADRARLVPLTKKRWAPGALGVGGRAAYLWCPNGILGSPLPAAVTKAVDNRLTARNWTTVLKLHALVLEPARSSR